MLKTIFHSCFLLFVLLFIIIGCKTQVDEPDPETIGINNHVSNPVMEVVVAEAIQGDFETTIQAQGVLRAEKKLELVWNAQGYINELSVQNGDRVKAGQVLARLTTHELEEDLRQAEINLQKARLNREDMLISGRLDSSILNPEKLENIDLLSGYRQASFDVEVIHGELDHQHITAPFDGIVYDLQHVSGSYVSPGQTFAHLVDNRDFRVEFEVLESELGSLHTGQDIEVQALSGQFTPFTSAIQRILPVISEEGLATVLAPARGNAAGAYFDGMKVDVQVKNTLPDRLIVPRSAIVIRSGRQVIFVYDPDTHQAKWNYVTTGPENATEVVITEGIKAGDQVIVEGNLNLSHDARVRLITPESQNEN